MTMIRITYSIRLTVSQTPGCGSRGPNRVIAAVTSLAAQTGSGGNLP